MKESLEAPGPKKAIKCEKVLISVLAEQDSTKSVGYQKGLEVVRSLDRVPSDATHRVTRIQQKREKTVLIGWVTIELLIRPIWTMTIGSGVSRSTVEVRPDK